MGKFKTIMIFILLVIASSIQSRIFIVPTDFGNIQDAINFAEPYDSIHVNPGLYLENITIGKDIKLMSSSGPEFTIIQGTGYRIPTVTIDSGVSLVMELNGFTITGGERSGIRIIYGSPKIVHNIITGNINSYNFAGAGILIENSYGSIITDNVIHSNYGNNYYSGGIEYQTNCKWDILAYNLFYNNGGDHVIGIRGSADGLMIHNNTITGSGSGIRTYGDTIRIFNNTLFDFPNHGVRITGGSVELDYNCFFENGINHIRSYGELIEGAHNISTDPQLVNKYDYNYNLLPYSPCIDAGYPFTDPYHPFNVIGALPYVLSSPIPYRLSVGNEIKYHVLNHTPTFYWSYFDTAFTQTAYQINVDTSSDWNSPALWSSGTILTSDTEIVYSGIPLEDSVTYYYRIQVYNGYDWSEWVASEFRMNTEPTTPIPFHPTALEYVTTSNVNLIVESSYDSESDSIVYDFELSEEIFFSVLSNSRYSVPHADSLTASGLFYGIPPATRFYWRCRSYDGYEYSEWSETESFLTQDPVTYYVPSEYPTIQSAIDIANDNDSIIVASGTYSGTGNRDIDFGGKNIVLKSESGAESTIIDCQGTETENHFGFIFQNSEDSTAVIDGFTITNAYAIYGGAISFKSASSGSVLNTIITNNQSAGVTLDWSPNDVYIDNCQISHNLNNGLRVFGDVTMTNSVLHSNGKSGATLFYGESTINNCTFALNAEHGLNLEGDPPKASDASEEKQYGTLIHNCVTAYNGSYGITRMFLFLDSLYCCNSFGNGDGNWQYFNAEWGFGNDSLNPVFCDTTNYDFRVSNSSPLLPANNVCNSLIGAFGVGCEGCCIGIRGNVDYDISDQVDISDLVYLVDFTFITPPGPPPPCYEEADMSIDNLLDISDIVFLVDFMFTGGPVPPSCTE